MASAPSPALPGAAPSYIAYVPMERTPRFPPTARAPPPPPKDKPVRKPPPPPPPRKAKPIGQDTVAEGSNVAEDYLNSEADTQEPAETQPRSETPPAPSQPLTEPIPNDPFTDAPPVIRPQPVMARRGRPSPISVAVANARTPTPTPTPAGPVPESGTPAAACVGFILAPASTDPFALAPCPRPAVAPVVLCRSCEADTLRHTKKSDICAARYCIAHWCGGCKRIARRLAAA
ncbi:hypothetical protein CcaverHIS002_0601380 [Cutaneotrichosporon cavernicola]|uniref:Uncharacterized protein n=1 Tax=Cutaneotrichosporon cavernicola TaxID=279322 RepID=A0AA48QWJ1_9TREE|nr:uncharacterized protein CcaverHIS019_0501470 [Cutaneotrichosporon cavernicola]BEI85851.1 hypothetical protein CcaverHIS002_0601380 [Cutaneotrichosporon cavernicola]BEI92519.1 hypothetical protein CcaverHIS019_0501470 [Cutaneotrichosporon cavernicola]BEJ00292.1 hypothetical protein CcaverHIS631_0501490 [Cutaneotrichosporon cavernicola]BEJ08062.1 hypothetical protein CcaverHIS641_0501470 [Cutaneotrichosporon cavernicola]